MGCITSSPEDKTDKAIQKKQLAAKLENEAAIQLFLVGSGDSGKSTIIKQLTNLNTSKFNDENYRKQHFASVIFSNLFDGVLALLDYQPSLCTEEERKLLQDNVVSHALPKEIALLMIKILKPNLDLLDKVRNLQDCFKIFAHQLVINYPAWGNDQEWIPSVEDCIRARVRTTGVLKQDFTILGRKFCLVDVGGQKAERRKWMHKFEDMNALIFVVAASEYDQFLFEDPTRNRLEDSLDLFEQISNSEFLRDKPMLLFLNKKDLFVEKVKHVPLSASGIEGAPNSLCSGSEEDFPKAVEWITLQFKKRREKVHTPLFVHLTCATDPENVKLVFEACKGVIFEKALLFSGL